MYQVECYKSTVCICIFLYADDIILLSPTVAGLRILVNAVKQVLAYIDMQLNVNKSSCIRFGAQYDKPCANTVSISGTPLQWVSECRYLGVYFNPGRVFNCSFNYSCKEFNCQMLKAL